MVQRMLAQRPPPTDVRYLRLEQPLTVDVRYAVILEGVRGLTGATARSRGQVRVARERPRTPVAPAPGAQRMVPADTTTRPDSLPAPAAPDSASRDTTAPPRERTPASLR
jgi:hypothetical protein